MKTEMTLTTCEHASGWKEVSLARVVRTKHTYQLLDLTGKAIKHSTDMFAIADAGRRYAENQGYENASYYAAA